MLPTINPEDKGKQKLIITKGESSSSATGQSSSSVSQATPQTNPQDTFFERCVRNVSELTLQQNRSLRAMNKEALFSFYTKNLLEYPESELNIYEAIINFSCITAKLNLTAKLADETPGPNREKIQKECLELTKIKVNIFSLLKDIQANQDTIFLIHSFVDPRSPNISWNRVLQLAVSAFLNVYNFDQPYFYIQQLILAYFQSTVVLTRLQILLDSKHLIVSMWQRQVLFGNELAQQRLRQIIERMNAEQVKDIAKYLEQQRAFNNKMLALKPIPQSPPSKFFKPALLSIIERVERDNPQLGGDFSTLKTLVHVEQIPLEIPSDHRTYQSLKNFIEPLELRFNIYIKALRDRSFKLKVISTPELELIAEKWSLYLIDVEDVAVMGPRVMERVNVAESAVQALRRVEATLLNRIQTLEQAEEAREELLDQISVLNSRLGASQLMNGLIIQRMPVWVSQVVMTLFLSSIVRSQELAAALPAPVAGGPDLFAPARVIRAVEALHEAAVDMPGRPTCSLYLGHHVPIVSFGRFSIGFGVEAKPDITWSSPRLSFSLKTKIEPYMKGVHASEKGFHLGVEGTNLYNKNVGITVERGWNFNKTSYTFLELLSKMSSGSQVGTGFYLEEERAVLPSLRALPNPYLVIQANLPLGRGGAAGTLNIPIRFKFNRIWTLDSKSISSSNVVPEIVDEIPEIAVPEPSAEIDLDTEVVVPELVSETKLSISKKVHYLQDLVIASNLTIVLGKIIPLTGFLIAVIRLQKNAPTKSVTLRAAHIAILSLDTRSYIALLVFVKSHILFNKIFKKGYFYKTPILAYGFTKIDNLSIYLSQKSPSIPFIIRKGVIVALNLVSLYRLAVFILSRSSLSTKALQVTCLGLYLFSSQKACEWLIRDEDEGKIDKR